MIKIKVGISFGIIFNDTPRETHELQHALGAWVEKQALHCISKTFDKEPSLKIDCIDFTVDFHVRSSGLAIECICIKRPPLTANDKEAIS